MCCLKMIVVSAIFLLPILANMVDGRQIFSENLHDDAEARQSETITNTKTDEMKTGSDELGEKLDRPTQVGSKLTPTRVSDPESTVEKNYFTDEFSHPLDIDILPLIKKLRSGTPAEELSIRAINAFNFPYLKNPQSKCQGTKDGPQILFLVKTALWNFERRLAIRQTWGSEEQFSNGLIRTVFLIGKSQNHTLQTKVDEEDAKYEDIVQFNYMDTYNNLTLKTISGLKWAVEHCSHASYFAFADDDMYISTKNMIQFLRYPSSYPDDKKATGSSDTFVDGFKLYAGHVNNNTSPKRHSSSKFYIPMSEYAFNFYPPYAAGGTYIFSRSALLDIYYGSMYTQRIFIEDAFVGIVARKVGIDPIHCREFNVHSKKPYSKPGSYRNVIASHGFDDPVELKLVWSGQHKLGFA